ncbi:uncharacterized protein LOC124498623 [Dermatophagoides farinae]|uniref:uncharacterized protein LOC124498623 n=1 Tax=Dermatophagoides farinae TaxID=6954 RepID=UPI003F5E81B2
MSTNSPIQSLHFVWFIILIWFGLVGNSSQTMASISQIIWPNQSPNDTMHPAIRLNLIGQNQSVANAFVTADSPQQADEDLINSVMINPEDIQFIVPNQPDQIGERVVEQIREQLGSRPISLGELKNKNMSFTLEMPGIQMNRTVHTNISDQTIVRRQHGQYQMPLPIPAKPFVMQTYMKKPNKMPVEHVYVVANSPKAATFSNYTSVPAPVPAYPPSVNAHASYASYPSPPINSYLAPLPTANYSADQSSLNSKPTTTTTTIYSSLPPVHSNTSHSKIVNQKPNAGGHVYVVANNNPPPPPPPPPASYTNAQAAQLNTSSSYTQQQPATPKIYTTNLPPLLKPKTDYASYLSQTGSASYVNPNNQPKVIYRYIEVCNGKPHNYNVRQDSQESAEALYNGYSKLSAVQSQLEHLKQMVQYYQSLIPQLNSYAQQYATVGAAAVMNPYEAIGRLPQYPTTVSIPSTRYGVPPQQAAAASYSSSYPAAYSTPTTETHDGGNVKMSYYAVEETYKTDNSSAIPAEMAIY